MNKTNLKLSLLFAVLGLFATGALLYGQQDIMGEIMSKTGEEVRLPPPFILYSIATLQNAALTFVLSFVGFSLAPKVNLKVPFFHSLVEKEASFKWSRKWLLISIMGGSLGFLLTYAMDYFIFAPHLPQLADFPQVVWWKGMLMGVLYGGIWEEIAIRLFLMTLIIWGICKLFFRKKGSIPSFVYWIGIITAAIVFGIAHLPTTAALLGELTPLLVIRAVMLNGYLGIFFGYLYWKRGLVYAMIAHSFAHIFNYGLMVHLLN